MAGSLISTPSDVGGGITKYSVAWICDAAGVVSTNTFTVKRGHIHAIKYFPGTPAPTDLYDMVITDSDGADILAGNGADLSATLAKKTTPSPLPFIEEGNLTLGITNAGNAKQGTVNLFIGP